jgi:hypothetical protein
MKKTLFLLLLTSVLTLSACNAQNLIANTQPFGTPMPRLAAVTPPPVRVSAQKGPAGACAVRAADLIGAWAKAGLPETDAFDFTAADGALCQGTFAADVLPLFNTPNLWYSGALSCVTCHGPDLSVSYAQLSLVTYQDILAGSRRASPDATGNSIFGDAWEQSILSTQFLTLRMPPGAPADASPAGPLVKAGKVK